MASFPEPEPWNGSLERRHDRPGFADPYRCVTCAWTGAAADAYDHHRTTGHAVRGSRWPDAWPDCQFTDRPKGRR